MPRTATAEVVGVFNEYNTFKIEMLSSFDGKRDVHAFIRRCKMIFETHNPNENLRVIALRTALQEQALDSYYLHRHELNTSEKIIQWLEREYGGENISLRRLNQQLFEKQRPGETVQDLINRFTFGWLGRNFENLPIESNDQSKIMSLIFFGLLSDSIVDEIGEDFYSVNFNEVKEKAKIAEQRVRSRIKPVVRFDDYANDSSLYYSTPVGRTPKTDDSFNSVGNYTVEENYNNSQNTASSDFRTPTFRPTRRFNLRSRARQNATPYQAQVTNRAVQPLRPYSRGRDEYQPSAMSKNFPNYPKTPPR